MNLHRVVAAALIATAAPLIQPAPAAAAPSLIWEREFDGVNYHSSPTIADVNGDGSNDVVVGDQDGWVRVFSGADGSHVGGWPQRVSINGTNPGMDGSPTVADLDNDGRNEVIVGAGTLRNPNQHGGVVVFNRDGSTRWTFVTKDRRDGPNGFSDAVFGTPAAADVSGDGFKDVVFGSYDHEIYVLDRNGGNLPGSPFFNNDTIFSSPAVYDFDFDGRAEILIGTDSSGTFEPNGGILWMIEYQGDSLRERWRRGFGEIIVSSPAIGNIDGDSTPEVVFGTGDFFHTAASREVWALNAESGSTVSGWPQSTGGEGWSSPALGDLSGDGRDDVAIGARDGRLYAWRGDGNQLWNVNPADGTPYTSGIITGGPIITDFDGNGQNDVVSVSGNAALVRNGANGGLVDAFSINWQFQNSAAVGTLAGNCRIVVAGYLDATNRQRIAAYDVPEAACSPWPMFHKNAAHTGAPDPPAPSGSSGYYVLDALGDVYAFGKARHFGSVPILKVHGTPTGGAQSVAISGTSDGGGYFVLDNNGGMFTFGNARFFGSVPGLKNAGVNTGDARSIALAVTSNNGGYYVLDEKGGMFTFGNARFFGSVPGLKAQGVAVGDAPSIALAVTPADDGYWVLDAKGGMFTFGGAGYFGSVPERRNQGVAIGAAEIVGMAPTSNGQGYWMVDRAGGIHSFGSAGYFGSIPQLRSEGVQIGDADIIGMVPTPSGGGYYLFDRRGGIFAFGDAGFAGSLPGVGVSTTAVSVTASR
ncbi:MAG: VCBS repeat-containing protein [Actinobacteria bacterium]|nr:VCBS repeat-containing protein [Actinomycetota bacterium]